MSNSLLLSVNGSDLNVNFSLSQALDVLDKHFGNDKIFDANTETTVISCYAILIFVGFFANLFVCSVVLTNAKMRSSRNILIINLNISDILLCVFCMPFTVLVIIRRNWILGDFLCRIVPFFQASTIFVSAATVLAIAIDRHNTIINFNPQNPHHGKRRMVTHTAAIWLMALVLSLPIAIFQGTIEVGIPGLRYYYKCVELWPNPHFKGIYTILMMIVQFVIPAVTLLVCHFQIRSHLNAKVFKTASTRNSSKNNSNSVQDYSSNSRQACHSNDSDTTVSSGNAKMHRTRKHPSSANADDSSSLSNNYNGCPKNWVQESLSKTVTRTANVKSGIDHERLKKYLKRNTRATMVLMNISVVFTISWLPWNVLNLLVDFQPDVLDPKHLYLAFAFCHMVAMSTSVTNPILYGWLNSNIRREMMRWSSAVVKVTSALVSNRNSHSDNQAMQQQHNALIRTSGENGASNKNNSESHV